MVLPQPFAPDYPATVWLLMPAPFTPDYARRQHGGDINDNGTTLAQRVSTFKRTTDS